MKLVKQIGFKLIVIMSIVMTFCCFLASTPVEASKVNTSDFYYSGTVKGTYTVEKGFFEKLVDMLDAILDYLLGLMTMGFRIVLVGWTALLERCLTWILEGAAGENVEIDKISTTNITGSDDYITLDAIFFNRVPLLDINVFNFEVRDDVTATGMQIEGEDTKQGETEYHNSYVLINTNNIGESNVVQGQRKDFYQAVSAEDRPGYDETNSGSGTIPYAAGQQQQQQQQQGEQEEQEEQEKKESLVIILKKAIAGWYYTFRLISIMVMLVLLVYIGIKLAIQSSTTEKALYKRVLFDWLVGMILVFSIHYIMIGIIQFNEILVSEISNLRQGATGLKVYEYGLIERAEKPIENDELEMTIYEEVKTRAYDAKMTVGTTGMIMYMVLVYYAWRYTFTYLKRYLTVAVLVIIAPLVAVSYAFNKVNTGKTKIFSNWLKEFFFIVILQSIHALIYVVFVDTALAISLNSISGILLTFMLFNFMWKAEDIFRKIFNVQGKLDVEKGGLKDAINNLKGGLVAIGAGKAAAKFTKRVAKTTMKPISFASGRVFGKIMEKRANSKEFKDKSEQDKIASTERLEKIRRGSIALALKNGQIDLAKLTETVDSLKDKKGSVIKNDDGEAIVVDDKYIAQEEKALAEIQEIANSGEQGMNGYIDNLNAMTTKWALMKHYAKGKWKDIMNPYQYVEKDENGVYHAIKTQRQFKRIGKKTDSVGMRLKEKLTMDNLLGLDQNTKQALAGQVDLLKSQVLGFSGILLGLPALVANPAVGAAFLYQGIKHSNQAYGYRGKNKYKELKRVKLMPDGKYTLVGFEGHSTQEIANEAKRQAREEAGNIFIEEANQDNKMVNRVRKKHPKVYAALKGTAKVGGAVTTAAAIGGTFTVMHPVTLPIAGMIIPVRNGALNAYTRLQETQRASNRANAKLYEKQVKSNDATLAFMADKYFELEADQHKAAANAHGEEFAAAYLAAKNAEFDKIDNMSDTELMREFGYEDIEIETRADGTKQLSGSSENSIIDNAIIQSAQKSGIMDISEFELSDGHMEQVSKEIETKLRKLGLIGKGISTSDVIQDLDKKIKDRQAILAKEGTKPVEEKMADQAIIETMMAGKGKSTSTDPNKVEEDAVMQRLKKMYGLEASEESRAAAESMQEKKDGSIPVENTRAIVDEQVIRQTIQERKAVLSKQAKKTISAEKSQQMREALKRKKSAEIDAEVLMKQDELDREADMALANERGGLDANNDGSLDVTPKSDTVLQMLNLQTKIHQDKLNLQAVGGTSKTAKLEAYKRQLFTSDGSVRVDVWQGKTNDGSRRVSESQSTTSEPRLNYATTRIEDVLITLNNK